MLEDEIIGPLFKTISRRPQSEEAGWHLTGPASFSVSKINQFVSLFIMCVWPVLLLREVVPNLSKNPADADIFQIAIIALGLAACVVMLWLGRSDSHDHKFHMTQHTSHVIKDDKAGREG